MAIQGMSQGLVFSNMSYYMHEQIPSIAPCNTPPLSAQLDIGVYNVTFNMGTATGCSVIVFEVSGDDSSPNGYTIAAPLGDKASWDYGGNRNSEYSCCQMAEPQPGQNYVTDTGVTRYRLMGRGYARGFIACPWQGFIDQAGGDYGQNAGSTYRIRANAIGNEQYWGNNSTPLSPKTGSRLLPAGGTIDNYTFQYVNNSTASGYLSASDSTRDIVNEDQAASTDFSAPTTLAQSLTKNAMLNDGVYRFNKNSNVPNTIVTPQNHINYNSAPSQNIEHGTFAAYNGAGAYLMTTSNTGLRVYNYLSPPGDFVLSNLTSPTGPAADDNLDYCGPYTGHHEVEIKDKFRNLEYPGSSAVTLDPGRFATRQAMMCVPVLGGGNVKVRVEAPLAGTWANIKVFCPISLPVWGSPTSATNGLNCGIEKFYTTNELNEFIFIEPGSSISASDHVSTNGSAATTTLSMQDNNFNPNIKVNHLITGAGISPGTIVTAILDQVDNFGTTLVGGSGYSNATGVATSPTPAGGTGLTLDITTTAGAVSGVTINTAGTGYSVGDVLSIAGGTGGTVEVTHIYYELTLSIAAQIGNAQAVTFHKSRLRQAFDDWNSLNANLTRSVNTPGDRVVFYNQLSKVIRVKPYATEAQALAHNFSNPASGNFKSAENMAAHHVPSQNSIYRIQGNGNFRSPTGGSPVDNHGEHVLGGHGSRPLAADTLNGTNALAHHGIVNEGDWVFTRDNAARRARLPARGIIDMTRYANNDIGTVGGWYAYECDGNQYAVQVGSLDYDRAEVTVDAVSGTIPRNGVVRTVTT